MGKITTAKVNTLPAAGNRSADTMYFVKSADPEYIDLYMTSMNAGETRRIINKSDIASLISTAIANLLVAETGIGTPRTLQNVFNADVLYRTSRRIAFELFAEGYNLENITDVAVISGTLGDNFIDIASTANIHVNEDYLLTNATTTVIVRPTTIISATRLQLSAGLANNWDNTAKLSAKTLTPNASGGADAVVGAQWISKKINLGNDNASRVVAIRRTANTGVVRLYYRDSYTVAWTEAARSVRIIGNDTNNVATGDYDDKYIVPLKGDGYIRIITETAAMTIKHIVGFNYDKVVVNDFLGDDGAPAAFQAAINCTPNAGTQYITVREGTYAGDLSTLTFGSRKIVWREESNVIYSGTAPFGIRNAYAPVSVRSIKDLVGVVGTVPDQQIQVASYHEYSAALVKPKGGGTFVWDSTKAKGGHNGVVTFSPTVPWDGTVATLANYHAKVGETNAGGTTGCWVRQYTILDVFMAGAKGDNSTDDYVPINSAFTVSKNLGIGLFFPAFTFLTSTTFVITTKWNFYGEGSSSTIRTSSTNTPLFKFDINTTSIQRASIFNIQLQGPQSTDPASCALYFTGDNVSFIQHCTFENIYCTEFNAFIKDEKTPRTTVSGLEAMLNWNIWNNIHIVNASSYGWWLTQGSGTGNTWSNIRCVTREPSSATWFFTGDGCVVGDVIINNAHLYCRDSVTGSIGIKVGDNTKYRSRWSITNCQFDADSKVPLDLSSVGTTEYTNWKFVNCSIGGNAFVGNTLAYMSQSIIEDKDVDRRESGKRLTTNGTGALSTDCFDLEMAANGSVIVEIQAQGNVGGVGNVASKYEFHITTDGVTMVITEFDSYLISSSQVTWTCTSIDPNKARLKVSYTPSATGTDISVMVLARGHKHKLTRL